MPHDPAAGVSRGQARGPRAIGGVGPRVESQCTRVWVGRAKRHDKAKAAVFRLSIGGCSGDGGGWGVTVLP